MARVGTKQNAAIVNRMKSPDFGWLNVDRYVTHWCLEGSAGEFGGVLGSQLQRISSLDLQGSPLTGANAPRFSNLHLEYVSLGARIAPRLPILRI